MTVHNDLSIDYIWVKSAKEMMCIAAGFLLFHQPTKPVTAMDAAKGVVAENGNGIIERTPLVDGLGVISDKENGNVVNGVDTLQVNDIPEDLSKVECLDSTVVADETSSMAVSESQSLNPLKVYSEISSLIFVLYL